MFDIGSFILVYSVSQTNKSKYRNFISKKLLDQLIFVSLESQKVRTITASAYYYPKHLVVFTPLVPNSYKRVYLTPCTSLPQNFRQ